MKLNKIYISAFGGLKDFTLELNDGLNVIYGNNEDGKSTVSAFIKAMFYGTGRNTKNLSESIRLKYTPWDNSTMAGRIFFEKSGKKYCLEREFRKSDSTDRIILTDLDSGKTIETAENIGQQFFGLSAAAFERSLFIGNGDFIKDDAATGEINGKLSNIAISGSEDVSYKKIEKIIFDERTKLISKSGRSGSYNEDLQQLAILNNRFNNAVSDAKNKTRLNLEAQEKRSELEKISKKYNELKALTEREHDYQNREKLIEFLQSKAKLDELNSSLTISDGTIINESYTQKIEFGINKYEKFVERCEQISQDIANIKEAIDLQNNASPENAKTQIDALTQEVENLTQQKTNYTNEETELTVQINEQKQKLAALQNKKSSVNPVLLILSILSACGCGVTAFFISPIVAAILFGAAAILLALSFIIKPKNNAMLYSAQNEINTLNTKLSDTKLSKNLIAEQINNINARINTLASVLHADSAIKQQRFTDLAQKNEALQCEQQKADDALAEILSSLSAFEGIDSIEKAKEKLQKLKQQTQAQKEIKLQLKTASQFLGNIDYAEAEQKLANIQNNISDENIDFDEINEQAVAVAEKISILKEELTIIATELKTSFKNSENPEDLKRQIAELQEKVNSKKSFCDAADLAISVLEESFYELRRGYGNELEKVTHNIFSQLTDGKYKSITINDSLDLSVEKADVFGTRELDYLSLGTTHQAYLSLRLAIATLISDNSPLPIFLDDSLSQYDDTRTKRAISFLKEFCNANQGILFTCHKSICDIAESQGIAIKYPYK